METKQLIIKVNQAVSYTEVFPDLNTWKDTFKEYIMQLHPDKCSEPGAADATSKLSVWKTEIEKGKRFKDDAGEVSYSINTVRRER